MIHSADYWYIALKKYLEGEIVTTIIAENPAYFVKIGRWELSGTVSAYKGDKMPIGGGLSIEKDI